jgi:hypothetical protein
MRLTVVTTRKAVKNSLVAMNELRIDAGRSDVGRGAVHESPGLPGPARTD